MTFDRLYTLLTEGLFHIPRHVYQDILDYYNESAKKVAENDIKRITDKTFPPKKFKIDLTGTRFEKLHELGDLYIVVTFSMKFDVYFHTHNKPTKNNKVMKNTLFISNTGNINLDFSAPTQTNIHYIEHEMLHFIQYLIQKYKKLKKYKTSDIGGLPPKDVVPTGLNVDGEKVDAQGVPLTGRQVYHTNRPVEFYPDLLSCIRQLQYEYYKHPRERRPSKEDYFNNFVKALKTPNSMLSVFAHISKIFNIVKRNNPKLYKIYLKTAYNEFVNNEPNFDIDNIKQQQKELEELREISKEKKKIADSIAHSNMSKLELLFNGKRSFTVDYYDRSKYSNMDDENYAFSEEVFERLPYTKRRESKKDGSEKYVISTKWKHLVKIFEKIKELKIVEKNKEWEKNYNFFAYNLLDDIIKHTVNLLDSTRKEVEELLLPK